jgi:hypothetical protein
VGASDFAGDGKAEAARPGAAVAAVVQAYEAIEDTLAVGSRDARTVVVAVALDHRAP